ncbi:MAG: type IV pilus assembly protein FimV [Woeseiaceae bacterium]
MKKTTANISTLAAVGGSLVAFPAAALELGDVKVNSSLGQPLRASIAYALAPNEALSNSCVSVQGGGMRGIIPGAGSATVSVANGVISIVGKSAVREPLITMRLNVHCPYAGRISRDYTMFIDPVSIAEQVSFAQSTAAAPIAVTAAPAARRATAPVARRVVREEPVKTGTRYQVAPGETLGDIAERIVDRPVALWPAVEGIFAANPDAFLDNDVNKLKAGSWLVIPDFGAVASLAVAPATTAEVVANVPLASDAAAGSVYTGLTEEQATLPAEITQPESEVLEIPDPAAVSNAPEIAAASAPAIIDIPDTKLEGPAASADSPNVATASISRPARVEESKTNWLLWLGGAGIGLIALLLFFGRMVRSRFGSSPIGTIEPRERRNPENSRTLEVVSEMEVTIEDEVTIDELDETQENLALDADLIIGSGLKESDEVDVAQDFGFAATTQIDHELLPEMAETAAADNRKGETDIIPPLNIEPQSILESEVLPDDEVADANDDYDMSVILDATQVPDPEDATLRDLEAIPVDTDNETLVSGDYTVSSEVDYTVLEQDYEDELTATQALNEEIARAAEELADNMSGEGDISMASVAALDVTAEIPANNDDDFGGDADQTGVNPELEDQVDDDDDVTAKFRSQEGKSA